MKVKVAVTDACIFIDLHDLSDSPFGNKAFQTEKQVHFDNADTLPQIKKRLRKFS